LLTLLLTGITVNAAVMSKYVTVKIIV